MTITYATSDSIGDGRRFEMLAGHQSLYVASGVIIGTTNGAEAIYGEGGEVTVSLDGTVLSGGEAVTLHDGQNTLSIGLGGILRSFETVHGNGAVFLSGGGNTLTNAGQIEAARSIGVLTWGGNSLVQNSGLITGSHGVFLGLFNTEGDRLINSGEVIASAANPLGGGRFDHGVFAEGNNSIIVNQAGGLIAASGAVSAGVAIGSASYGGDGSRVVNMGQITSAGFWGVDFGNLNSGAATLTNSGTISGQAGAFRGNGADDLVVNRGLMLGDVALGAGNDAFLGLGGRVEGSIDAGSGDDDIRLSHDGMIVSGGDGRDTLRAGADVLYASEFEDIRLTGDGDFSITGDAADTVMRGNSGANRISGGDGADTIYGQSGNDDIEGGAGRDALRGGIGNDVISGGDSNDYVLGDDGDDLLIGDEWNDTLLGGSGNDTIFGGMGEDRMDGGLGDDIFVFTDTAEIGTQAGAERIISFQSGSDRIDLSAIADAPFTFRGQDGFSATGVIEVAYRPTLTGNSLVEIDNTGNGVADAVLVLTGTTQLTAEDFIL